MLILGEGRKPFCFKVGKRCFPEVQFRVLFGPYVICRCRVEEREVKADANTHGCLNSNGGALPVLQSEFIVHTARDTVGGLYGKMDGDGGDGTKMTLEENV